MPFSLTSCRRITRLRLPVLVALRLTAAACGDSAPTSPDAAENVIQVLPEGAEPVASLSFAGGIPLGNFDQPLSVLGSIFNGAHANTGPTLLLLELTRIKAQGGKVILALS